MSFTEFFTSSSNATDDDNTSSATAAFTSVIGNLFSTSTNGSNTDTTCNDTAWVEPASCYPGYTTCYPGYAPGYVHVSRRNTFNFNTRSGNTTSSSNKADQAQSGDTMDNQNNSHPAGIWAKIGTGITGTAVLAVAIGAGITAAPILGVGAAIASAVGLAVLGLGTVYTVSKVVKTDGRSAVLADAGANILKVVVVMAIESLAIALGIGAAVTMAPLLTALAGIATVYVIIEVIVGLVVFLANNFE